MGLERGKQRFLIKIGKVVAQPKSVGNMGRKKGPKFASVFVSGKMSWATATRSILKCKIRMKMVGGSRVNAEPTARGLDAQGRDLLWTREGSTCCSMACVSTPDVRGHSWPPSAVGKVYREFAIDHGTCHAFSYACTQIMCRPSNSLCDFD